jgi:hypothetical protein
MKNKFFSVLLVLVLVLTGIAVKPVQAGAYHTPFTTSITYQNVGDGPATISLTFFAESSANPITIDLPQLAKMAGSSIYVGSVGNIANGFKGSAIMSSNQPIVATLVQVAPSTSAVKVRPLSNGFTAGSSYVLVPTVLKQRYDYNSVISVQNVDTVNNDYRLEFVPTSGAPISITVSPIPPGATKYFDLGTISGIPAGFSGSLQIYATKTGSSTGGLVVATAMELAIGGYTAYAFEGTNEFANKIYMPSAMCRYSGKYDSSYAVQNTTSSNISVTVKYSNGSNHGPITLAPGAKQSFVTCDKNPAGFIGSATIEATGNIVAMGKIYGGGLSTAFLGFPRGASKVALPYVRWTTAHWANGARQRAYIAIQNVGGNLAAGAVVVKYYDKNGNLVGSRPLPAIPAGGKVNSTAEGLMGGEFGYYADNTYGGSAVVEGPAGSQLAVVVRIQQVVGGGAAGEDYNGISIQ